MLTWLPFVFGGFLLQLLRTVSIAFLAKVEWTENLERRLATVRTARQEYLQAGE